MTPHGVFLEGLTRPLANRIEHTFLERVQTLPRDAQRLLLTAAAEPLRCRPAVTPTGTG